MALLVIRNGYIVLEEYYSSYHMDRRHIIYSCTKSITSTLIGIAIEEGYIGSVDDFILDYLHDYNISQADSRLDQITIEHLLTMSSGLEWSEGGGDDDYFSMGFSDNWVEYVLNRPMIADPGEVYQYNTGGSHLLAAILNISTGMRPLSFGETHLFNPIGIEDIYWPTDTEGINNGGSDFGVTPRDMARFGFLFLNNGSWDGNQLVPDEWVEDATSTKIDVNTDTGYGYQWWTTPSMHLYSARGYNGQFIVVIPEHDLVVVTTADDPDTFTTLFNILSTYIIPAVENFVPAPDNSMIIILAIASVVAVVLVVFGLRKTIS
ncbi:MAG: serine hydrolase domain-containing protein [Candidatus Thorarchaeota archaeon]|jgi:CubicO group peptidase (beta-lactamase class C family)